MFFEITEAFSSLDPEVGKTLLPAKYTFSYKCLSKALQKKVLRFLSQGYYINSQGITWCEYLHKQGYSLHAIYLSHRIGSLGITTHYFSLLAESCSSSLLNMEYKNGLSSLPSFFHLRLSLAVLSELERVDLLKLVEEKLKLTCEEDIKALPPLLLLLVKIVLSKEK